MSTQPLPGLQVSPTTGTTSLSGDLLTLSRGLDLLLADLAGHWSPLDEHHPALLPSCDLVRSGWLPGFPHLALTACGLDPERTVEGDLVPTEPTGVLAPAACHAVYPAHAGEDLEAPLYVRVSSPVFRCESSFSPLRRQRVFTMREVVCVGTSAEVDSFLEGSLAAVDLLLAELGIEAPWVVATDPFYRPDAPAALVQRLVPLKREATLAGDDLAIASVNVHSDHFTEAFSLTRDGEVASSGCVAFGLERWVWAWCAAHGPDPTRWPPLPRREAS